MDKAVSAFGRVDALVSNAGIQTVGPIQDFDFTKWKQMLAIHLDGAFLTTRAALKHMYQQGTGGSIIYMGSVHSKEASMLKAPYVTAKHGLIGLAKVVAKEGARHGVRANVICPGFVRTPLVDRQIPEQAKALGLSEEQVIKGVMLKDTVDGEFTTVEDVAEAAVFFRRLQDQRAHWPVVDRESRLVDAVRKRPFSVRRNAAGSGVFDASAAGMVGGNWFSMSVMLGSSKGKGRPEGRPG
jgi:NAD(P)-dependent dehydrogenase (short-subunit alcohol dehydrogenase family)